jgi:ketosteroid isomerase-like protein
MKLFITLILLLCGGCFLVIGQTADKKSVRNSQTERELLKANQAYDEALTRGDAMALDRIYADEFVYTTFDGTVRDKNQQLSFTKSGDLQLEFGKSDDVRIRIYENTAVMTGRFTAKGKFRGKEIDIRERYTAVWVRQDGRWRLVAEQGNEIKQQ